LREQGNLNFLVVELAAIVQVFVNHLPVVGIHKFALDYLIEDNLLERVDQLE
jgi:hypothetical protein